MDILKRAQEIQPEVVANRHCLHENPELGFALDDTVGFVKEKLVLFLMVRGELVCVHRQAV